MAVVDFHLHTTVSRDAINRLCEILTQQKRVTPEAQEIIDADKIELDVFSQRFLSVLSTR